VGSTRIVVLGGYGRAGSAIARLLLRRTGADVVIAGRNLSRAEALADEVNAECGASRASGVCADADDAVGLEGVLSGARMLVVASTTVAYVRQVVRAALRAGTDYLDIHYPSAAFAALKELRGEIDGSGRCVISLAGFHPGLPSVLIRFAAARLSRIRAVQLFLAMNVRVDDTSSVGEIIDEIAEMRPEVYRAGAWRAVPYRECLTRDLGPPFGERRCFPVAMEEVRGLPSSLVIDELGVYVAGFNKFVDGVVLPLAAIAPHIGQGFGRAALSKWMIWGIRRFSPPQQRSLVRLEATGENEGGLAQLRVEVEHDDAYVLTVAPVVACLEQYLDGSRSVPGLHMMGHLVDPARLLQDVASMGVRVRVSEGDAASGA